MTTPLISTYIPYLTETDEIRPLEFRIVQYRTRWDLPETSIDGTLFYEPMFNTHRVEATPHVTAAELHRQSRLLIYLQGLDHLNYIIR